MPRQARNAPGGLVYHVLNRANGRLRLFKSFPVQEDDHLLTLLRYLDRNPLRAGIVKRAHDWRWGSYHVRRKRRHDLSGILSDGPIDLPEDWPRWVHEPQSKEQETSMSEHITRSRPLGAAQWISETAQRLGLEHSLRPPGRPRGWRKPKPRGKGREI